MFGRFLKYWLPLILWMVIIFAASGDKKSGKHSEQIVRPPVQLIKPDITEPQFRRVHFDVRKAAHFIEYAIFAFLLWRAIRSEPKFAKTRIPIQITIVILAAALYAGSDEYHQRFVQSRGPSIRDVLIDTCGATFGVLVFGSLNWRDLRKKRESSRPPTVPSTVADLN
jgi:VanZ family protein